MVSMTLEIEEEECLVSLLIKSRQVDGTSNGHTKLVAVRIRAWVSVQSIEVVVRVECTIAQIVVNVSMQSAAAGFCNDIDYISRAPTVLRGERVLLDFEFLHVIGRWNIDHTAPTLAGVPRAIQEKRRRAKIAATEIKERNVLVGGALLPTRRNGLSLRKVINRRIQFHKIEHIAQVEWQFRDLLAGDFLSDIRVVCLQ